MNRAMIRAALTRTNPFEHDITREKHVNAAIRNIFTRSKKQCATTAPCTDGGNDPAVITPCAASERRGRLLSFPVEYAAIRLAEVLHNSSFMPRHGRPYLLAQLSATEENAPPDVPSDAYIRRFVGKLRQPWCGTL